MQGSGLHRRQVGFSGSGDAVEEDVAGARALECVEFEGR